MAMALCHAHTLAIFGQHAKGIKRLLCLCFVGVGLASGRKELNPAADGKPSNADIELSSRNC